MTARIVVANLDALRSWVDGLPPLAEPVARDVSAVLFGGDRDA